MNRRDKLDVRVLDRGRGRSRGQGEGQGGHDGNEGGGDGEAHCVGVCEENERDVTEVVCRAREPRMKGRRGGGDQGLGRGRRCLVDEEEWQPKIKIEIISSSGRLLYTILATRLVEVFFTLA